MEYIIMYLYDLKCVLFLGYIAFIFLGYIGSIFLDYARLISPDRTISTFWQNLYYYNIFIIFYHFSLL